MPIGPEGRIIALKIVSPGVYEEVDLNDYYLVKSNVRIASASATKNVNCTLTWDTAFGETEDYGFILNAWDNRGNPVFPMLVSQRTENIVVKTLVNATVTAIAKPL